ncbi:MAG: hypothetical protein CBC48_20450 [bacterium TMED88]|nr:MAG: hypothetical protein CBC48_20450 [bacterium TMED88]
MRRARSVTRSECASQRWLNRRLGWGEPGGEVSRADKVLNLVIVMTSGSAVEEPLDREGSA